MHNNHRTTDIWQRQFDRHLMEYIALLPKNYFFHLCIVLVEKIEI